MFNFAADIVKITNPKAKEKIIEVIWFLGLCATKFFLTIVYIDFFSRNNKMERNTNSRPLCSPVAIKERPMTMATKIAIKISNNKLKLNVIIDRGSK